MFLKWKRGDHAVAAVQKFRCFEREILTLSREERGSERGIYRHARSSRDDDLDDDRFLGSITLSFFLRGEINKLRGR